MRIVRNTALIAEWFAWLQTRNDEQLIVYWAYVRDWKPGCICGNHEDPYDMQIKYELTAQLMSEREVKSL